MAQKKTRMVKAFTDDQVRNLYRKCYSAGLVPVQDPDDLFGATFFFYCTDSEWNQYQQA
jgi:hypothetical protein